MLERAGQRGADSLILNLEDAVAPANKAAARDAVVESLRTSDFGGCERIVRINPIGAAQGYRDLLAIVPAGPDSILLPKVRDPEEVRFAAWTIHRLEMMHDLPIGGIGLMCMIESAAGVLAAPRIAGCSERVEALIFGAADYTEDVGLTPSADRSNLIPPLTQVVLAARAAGISAIDAPHMLPADEEGLIAQARLARSLGFDGKSAIHPAQISTINAVFSPQPHEIIWARRVLSALALRADGSTGAGAALMDGELVEAPHVSRAQRILAYAEKLNLSE